MKYKRPPIAQRLHKVQFRWVPDKNKGKIPLNGKLIKFHVKLLLTKADIRLPTDLRINLDFSKGLLDRVKKRHKSRFRRLHGEAMSSEDPSIRDKMPPFNLIIANYAHADV